MDSIHLSDLRNGRGRKQPSNIDIQKFENDQLFVENKLLRKQLELVQENSSLKIAEVIGIILSWFDEKSQKCLLQRFGRDMETPESASRTPYTQSESQFQSSRDAHNDTNKSGFSGWNNTASNSQNYMNITDNSQKSPRTVLRQPQNVDFSSGYEEQFKTGHSGMFRSDATPSPLEQRGSRVTTQEGLAARQLYPTTGRPDYSQTVDADGNYYHGSSKKVSAEHVRHPHPINLESTSDDEFDASPIPQENIMYQKGYKSAGYVWVPGNGISTSSMPAYPRKQVPSAASTPTSRGFATLPEDPIETPRADMSSVVPPQIMSPIFNAKGHQTHSNLTTPSPVAQRTQDISFSRDRPSSSKQDGSSKPQRPAFPPNYTPPKRRSSPTPSSRASSTRGSRPTSPAPSSVFSTDAFMSILKPSRRLIGEIAFQLDRRILNYVFNYKGTDQNADKRRYYGYIIQNIPEKIIRECADPKSGHLDAKKKHILQYRYDHVIRTLRPIGYRVEVHGDFAADMVNKYGLLPVPSFRGRSDGVSIEFKDAIKEVLTKVTPLDEADDVMIMVDALYYLALEDGKPLLIW